MKIGLANLAIIIVLYLEGTKEAAVCNFVRILIVGFMFGNLFSIFFALAGATLSMIVMVIMKKTNKFSIMIVSMFGGIFHNIGQIVVASFVVDNYYIFGVLNRKEYYIKRIHKEERKKKFKKQYIPLK